MPQDEGGLKGVFYGISDKAWSLAEWMESKGLPLASFCDKHHINPLLLFIVIILAIIILLALVMGASFGVSYGVLSVTVNANGAPLQGALVYYDIGDERMSNETNALGKAQLKFPIGLETELFASKDGYKIASSKLVMEEDEASMVLSLEKRTGTLKVNVEVAGGRTLPSGSYVVVTAPGQTHDPKPVINGVATFPGLPAGVEVTAHLSIGNQKIPPAGEKVTIIEDQTREITINVPESSLTTSLEVKVKDSAYQNVDGATVQLFDWDTQTPVGTSAMTSGGTATISGIVMGTSVYATVLPSGGGLSSYNGKTSNYKLDVSRSELSYEVTLQIVGRVDVCVYDENGYSLGRGSITLKDASGQTHATRQISQTCEEFSGLPEGTSIYPVVTAEGYLPYDSPSNAKTIDYSGITRFDASMQLQSAEQEANIFVHVSDCDGNPINGIKVKIIDASTLSVLSESTAQCAGTAAFNIPTTVTIPSCGNVAATITAGRDIYAVAFADGYVMGMSTVATANGGLVLDIIACEADDSNSGNFEVCVYKDGAEFSGATLELYDNAGHLLWTARTNQGEDDRDYCYTFMNIPAGTTVHAKALNLGTSPEVTDTYEIVGGETASAIVYTGSQPVFIDKGDVKVCVTDAASGLSLTANVSLYDYTVGQIIRAAPTGAGGCFTFVDEDAQVNNAGQIIDREIYVVVEKDGYANYNGLDEGDVLEMVPNGELVINLELPEAYELCVQVMASDTGEPLTEDTRVVLYYNNTENSTPIQTKRVDANGIARFYQARKDEYFFKVLESYTLYQPDSIYSFDREEVSEGECGIITVRDLGSLCNLGLEVLDTGDSLKIVSGQPVSIPFRVLKDGERGDLSATTDYVSNRLKIQLIDGGEANVTMRFNNAFKPFSLSYENTEYSAEQELIASLTENEVGTYSGLLEVAENSMCSRQAVFTVEIYEEELHLSVDSVSFDPAVEDSKSFCIYLKDEDGDDVTDASVRIQVDDMDGWDETATRAATWDNIRNCYRGSITRSMAPTDTSGDYKAGTYSFWVYATRAGAEVTAEAQASIAVTDLCGNGVIDDGEDCEEDSDCNDGYICVNCLCEEEDCGSLSVSADSATAIAFSGTTSGFCAYVSDSCGVVEDATVTASFSAWPSAATQSVSYDASRGCYYVTLSDNVVWPANYCPTPRTTGLGTRDVSINAQKDNQRSGTTATVTVECGCDNERWCEANCLCDGDCDDSGSMGNLNLAGCLQLGMQQGYTPAGMSGYNPYMYNPFQGSQQGRDPCATSAYNPYGGGLSMAPGQFGMTGGTGAGFNLDWEACKELFGWGSSGKGYVLVMDDAGIITSANCQAVVDKLTADKSVKYVHVRSVQSGNDICCTGRNCDFNNFNNLMQTAVSENNARRIDLIVARSTQDLSRYEISDAEIIRGDGGAILYDTKDTKLFGKGVAFSFPARRAPSGQAQNANSYQLIGVIDSGSVSDLGAAITSWVGETSGMNRIAYVREAEAARSIVLADNIEDGKKLIEGSVYFKGGETGLREAMFSSSNLNEDTLLYIIADGLSMQNPQTTAQKVAKTMASQYPVFERVSKLSFCRDGGTQENPWGSNPVLLRASYDAYVVSMSPNACALSNSRLTFTPRALEAAQRLAYAKKSSENVYLLLTGSPGFKEDAIAKFKAEKANLDSDGKILVPDEWAILPAKQLEGQACGVESGQREARKKALARQVPDSRLPIEETQRGENKYEFMIDCAYGGEPGEAPAILSGTVNWPNGVTDLTPGQLTIRVAKADNSKVRDFPMGSTMEVETSGNAFTFKILELNVNEIPDAGYPLKVWATWEGTTGALGSTVVCYTAAPLNVEKSGLVPGIENNIATPLQLSTDFGCVENIAQKYTFTIRNLQLTDALEHALTQTARLILQYPDSDLRPVQMPNGRLDSHAIQTYDGAPLTINAELASDTTMTGTGTYTLTATSSGTGFNAPTSAGELRDEKLKIDNALNLGLVLRIKNKDGNYVSGGNIRISASGGVSLASFFTTGGTGSAQTSNMPVVNNEGRTGIGFMAKLGQQYPLEYKPQNGDWVSLSHSDCSSPAIASATVSAGVATVSGLSSASVPAGSQTTHAQTSEVELCVDLSQAPATAQGGATGIVCEQQPTITFEKENNQIMSAILTAICWNVDTQGNAITLNPGSSLPQASFSLYYDGRYNQVSTVNCEHKGNIGTQKTRLDCTDINIGDTMRTLRDADQTTTKMIGEIQRRRSNEVPINWAGTSTTTQHYTGRSVCQGSFSAPGLLGGSYRSYHCNVPSTNKRLNIFIYEIHPGKGTVTLQLYYENSRSDRRALSNLGTLELTVDGKIFSVQVVSITDTLGTSNAATLIIRE